MCEGRRSQVVLLDERRLDLVIQPKLYAGELLDLVASHFQIKEKEYFGIAYYPQDSGQFAWLQLDKRVLEHDLPKKTNSATSSSHGNVIPVLTFHFRVKYYVENITQLRDSATVEAFYLQAKSLVAKGELEGDSEIIFQLAAFVLQATYSDYVDESMFSSHLRRIPILPAFTLKEFPSISECEERVLQHYKNLAGQQRGAAIVNYLSVVETLPTYGQHYYEIKDKTNSSCWLGLSYKGISQYDKNDRRNPKKVFLWKQLENLYYRDRKFTIEVHEARRVIHTLSSFNLYEDAIEEPVEEYDDLSDAICDPTTQVSVSRRSLAPANVTVYVWYASSAAVAKCIWSMAIAQHHFFLNRKHQKSHSSVFPNLSQIASELCRSVQSLSSAGSHSNISRSTSTSSLPSTILGGELSEESKAATIEMLSALQARREALEEALKKKTEELKTLCLKEGELTGEIPPELPLQPGEARPQVRRRVGTSFSISDKIISKARNKERETLGDLELEYEIQSKIASAAFQLANDCTARKSVRKQRKVSYVRATDKLRKLELKLNTLQREKKKAADKGIVIFPEETDSAVALNHGERESPRSSCAESSCSSSNTVKSCRSGTGVPPCTSLPQLTLTACDPEPQSPPEKCRQRHQSLQHIAFSSPDDQSDLSYESCPWSIASYSPKPESSTSCNSGIIQPMRAPYRNRFEPELDIDGSNLYSVPNRRASQIFDSQDDLLLNERKGELVDPRSTPSRIPASQTEYSHSIPLSSSYDEHLWYGKAKKLATISSDCSSLDTSFEGYLNDTCETASLNCFQSSQRKVPFESTKKQPKLLHFHSENSLHNNELTSISQHLQNTHISEPELVEPVDVKRLTHMHNVPHLHVGVAGKSGKDPLLKKNSSSGSNNNSYSVNQVADLVNASVLLQGSKRSASTSSAGYLPPKSKTKEWIETSLDSPPPVRKQKTRQLSESSQQNDAQENVYSNIGNNQVMRVSPFQNDQYCSAVNYAFSDPVHENSNLYSPKAHQNPVIPRSNPDSCCISPQASDERWVNSDKTFNLLSASPQEPRFRESFRDPFVRHACFPASSKDLPSAYSEYYNWNGSELVNGNVMSYAYPHSDMAFEQASVFSSPYQQDPRTYPARNCDERQATHDCYPGALSENSMHEYCSPSITGEVIPQFKASNMSEIGDADKCDIPGQPSERLSGGQISPSSSILVSHDEGDNFNVHYQPCHFSKEAVINIPQEKAVPLSPCDPAANFSYPASVQVNVVTVGHFQPYWEETKPYELSDFYKYSTKHRKLQQKPSVDDSTTQTALPCAVTDCDVEDKNWCETRGQVRDLDVPINLNKPVFEHSCDLLTTKCAPSSPNISHEILVNAHISVVDHAACGNLNNHCIYDQDLNNSSRVSPHQSGDENSSFSEIAVPASLADTFHKEMFAWYENRDTIKKATLV